MIRKILSLQKLYGIKRFDFCKQTEEIDILQKVLSILKLKKPPLNIEIQEPQVQLIDHNEKFLGVKNIKDALQLAEQLNLDLVLENSKVFPVICKLYDYESQVYKAFSKEYMKKYGFQSEYKNFMKVRSFEIKPFIISQDLQLKIKQILLQAKQSQKIKIKIFYHDQCLDDAKDVLTQIKDQLLSKMNTLGDMHEQQIQVKTEKWEQPDPDDEGFTHFIIQDFEKKEEFQNAELQTSIMDKEEIKKLITKFFMDQDKNKMISNIQAIQNEEEEADEQEIENSEVKQIFTIDEYQIAVKESVMNNILTEDEVYQHEIYRIAEKYEKNKIDVHHDYRTLQMQQKSILLQRMKQMLKAY